MTWLRLSNEDGDGNENRENYQNTMFAGASLFWSGTSIAVERWSPWKQTKLGLSHPYRIWGKEKESQICSFRSSSRKINQFTVNRYIESHPCSRSRNNLVRLVKILAGEFKIKNLCGILKLVYWQLKLCIVLTLYFFLFFYCRNKMKYSQLVSKFVLYSKQFDPGN